MGRVGVWDATNDQPGGDLFGLGLGGERGERDLGDLRVADPLLGGFVVDGIDVLIGVHESGSMASIAARTGESIRAVIEKQLLCRKTAAITADW